MGAAMSQNEIHLYGTVGASFWDEDYFTPKTVRQMLEGRTGPLTVRLNSGGGIASDGQAIYTMLKDYPDEVEIVVDGVAASAASLIAMAGDRITMRLGSWMLIHDPASMFTTGRGTADDHRELAAFLDKIGDAYAGVYAARTGMSPDAAREIMRAETVYLGDEAVEAGFATQYEGDEQAAEAAAFDYRIYANAPEVVRTASERLGARPGQMALAAFIAGQPRNVKETPVMADTKKAAAVPTAEIETPEVKAPEAETQEPAPAAAPAPVAAVTMSAVQASRLYQIAARASVSAEVVAAAIEAGHDFETALEKISAQWKEQGDVDTPMHGRPTARILRDERETMRTGMEQALIAQMSRRAPASDMARPYMAMSLVEMAAQASGYTGPMRTAHDRQQVFMATHSTSDFPHVFENALNKQLEARYRDAVPTYRSIARQVTFNDFRPHPMVRVGDFPELQEINEGGEIKFGTFGEKRESVAVKSYAIGVRISRHMLINDELDAIAQIVADRGRAIARFEDKLFYAMMLSGSNSDGPTLAETSRQVFNATDKTKASGGAAIDVTSLAAGRAALRKQVGIDGAALGVAPSILLVGPDKETQAEQLVAPVAAAQAGNVNPFSGRLSVVTTEKITGNAWYLFADPADVPCFVYGFLSGFDAPRMRMDEPFGQQGMALSVEHDFGVGAIDFRGGYKNSGA
jgi:ATP-dependent protease ClpP protease subunit/phage major head subunit gpT-like protein